MGSAPIHGLLQIPTKKRKIKIKITESKSDSSVKREKKINCGKIGPQFKNQILIAKKKNQEIKKKIKDCEEWRKNVLEIWSLK